MDNALLHRLAGFAGHLRDHGFGVGIPEQQAMLVVVQHLPVRQYRQIQPCWRAIVCSNRDQWRRYPELFDLYWFPERVRGSARVSGMTRRSRNLTELVASMRAQMDGAGAGSKGLAHAGAGDDGEGAANESAAGGASAVDPLVKRDFGAWLQSDLQQLNSLAEDVARKIRKRLLRRKQVVSTSAAIDLRATIRKSVSFGGLPIAPVWQRPRRELPNIFILVDVSRSMEMYAQLFLRVTRAFCEVTPARAFVFHTRISEVTDLLRKRSGRVQEKINAVTFGFGGGTRIASSLRDFVALHARSALAAKSVVLVLSDGYDNDPPEELGMALQSIAGKNARIFWLHPSARAQFSASLQLASPYVSRFMPANNLESLQKLPDLIY